MTAIDPTGIAPVSHREAAGLGAVEYCRILSGRASGGGLLATPVPF